MKLVRSIVTAFCMFSRIPMPQIEWKDENMRYMLAAFPLVGLAVGALSAAVCVLLDFLGVPALVRGAVLLVFPLLLTGGIHMDGFADTMDALSSHAPAEKKRAILKDPHSGAFAVISVCAIMILDFACLCHLPSGVRFAAAFGMVFVLSRSFSGLCSCLYPSGGGQGLLRSFRESADKKATVAILVLCALFASAALCILLGAWALLLPAGSALLSAYLFRMSQKEFGGMSGDLSGWFLTVSETVQFLLLLVIGGI